MSTCPRSMTVALLGHSHLTLYLVACPAVTTDIQPILGMTAPLTTFQHFLDLGPILGRSGEQLAATVLAGDGALPAPLIDQPLDLAADQIGDHGGRKRVQLPTFVGAEAVAVTAGAGVALLDKAWGRVVAPHLIQIQRNAANLDIVAGHVDTIRIVVGKMQDQRS